LLRKVTAQVLAVLSSLATIGAHIRKALTTRSDCGCRSLVTTLRAAEKFDHSHLSSPEVAPLIDGAKLFYVEGYFLTHGIESALELSKKASETSKVGRRLLSGDVFI
jgi:hypothetical protein